MPWLMSVDERMYGGGGDPLRGRTRSYRRDRRLRLALTIPPQMAGNTRNAGDPETGTVVNSLYTTASPGKHLLLA